MSNDNSIDFDFDRLNQLFFESAISGLGPVGCCRTLAAQLSLQIAPKNKTWSWNYLHQVLHQKLPLSKDLRKAIQRLYKKTRRHTPLLLQKVTVLAPPGFVIDNSIVGCPTRLCTRLGCGISFIPNSPNQKYHSENCRKLARRSRSDY